MNYFMRDQITTTERLNFERKKTWKELLWSRSKLGYSIELTTGKMLLSDTPMTTRGLQTLVKRGEQGLQEAKKLACVTPLSWSCSA